MPEDQLTALPPDVRQMVMTGTTAMMNGGGPNPGMMGPGVMMDMSMMGPMGMGMNGDMGMSNAMMQGMMQVPDGNQGQQGVNVGNGTPEHAGGGVGMMQDGFHGGPGAGGMMNMSMGNDFGMQVRVPRLSWYIQVLLTLMGGLYLTGAKCNGTADVP